MVTSLGSQQSVVWSIITAGWEFSEGTECWEDLRLDWRNSGGAFQSRANHKSRSGLRGSLSLSLPFLRKTYLFPSNVEGHWNFQMWNICFLQCVFFHSMYLNQNLSILANLTHCCTLSLLIRHLSFFSLHYFLNYGLVESLHINSFIFCTWNPEEILRFSLGLNRTGDK